MIAVMFAAVLTDLVLDCAALISGHASLYVPALSCFQASHLQAVCDDESVTTILVVSDETCRREYYSPGIPTSCFQNVIRIFPYNTVVR